MSLDWVVDAVKKLRILAKTLITTGLIAATVGAIGVADAARWNQQSTGVTVAQSEDPASPAGQRADAAPAPQTASRTDFLQQGSSTKPATCKHFVAAHTISNIAKPRHTNSDSNTGSANVTGTATTCENSAKTQPYDHK